MCMIFPDYAYLLVIRSYLIQQKSEHDFTTDELLLAEINYSVCISSKIA